VWRGWPRGELQWLCLPKTGLHQTALPLTMRLTTTARVEAILDSSIASWSPDLRLARSKHSLQAAPSPPFWASPVTTAEE
jgi:hypothetical protein